MKRRWMILALLPLALLVLAPTILRSVLWRWEQNPILEGRRLAEEVGCLHCHRPFAGREIPNRGSRWGTIPAFQGGNAFMYGASRQEIEEFIRHGAPRDWLEEPTTRRRLEEQQLRMPAYEDRLSEREISNLVAFATAIEGVDLPKGDDIEAGRQIARERGCLSCHGLEGSGGLANPGSLGGFIPGFLGRNFNDLVKDEDEFQEWVRTGTSQRLARNPVLRFFWKRQTLSMPAYEEQLEEHELRQLWRWIEAARSEAGS